MDLHQLELFAELSKTLHFGRTAERVHLSQSSVSRQIQNLEGEVGVRLFERLGRRVVLTTAGEVFQRHAQKIIDDLADARRALGELTANLQGHLTIGSFDSALGWLAPRIIAAFRARHPSVTVALTALRSKDAPRALRQGDTDAAIIATPAQLGGLHLTPLLREELRLTLPTRHPLGRSKSISVAALEPFCLIAGQVDQSTRLLIDRALSEAGAVPASIIEMETTEAVKGAVRAGLGVGVLGAMAFRGPGRSTGLVSRPFSPPIFRMIGLATRYGRPANPTLVQFAEVAQFTALQLGLARAVDLEPPSNDGQPYLWQ